MEFCKLYKTIHRRTDWEKLYKWQRETIMPEWYEEKKRKSKESLAELMCAYSLATSMLDRY